MSGIGCFGIISVKEKILLVRHSYGEKKLSLPGGGLEKGETPDLGVRRECLEEVGVDIEFGYIGTYFLHKSAGVLYLFKGTAPENILFSPQDGEITEVILADPHNLPPDIYPAQRKLIDRWVSGDLGTYGSFYLL